MVGVIFLFSVWAAVGAESQSLPCAEAVQELEKALALWDAGGFERSATQLQEDTHRFPDSGPCAYWAGVAAFHQLIVARQMAQAGQRSTPEIRQMLDSALALVREAARRDPRNAENQALLCVLSGMKIEESPWRALWWGPRVMRHGRKAMELDKNNPRVQYLLGSCRFHSSKIPKDFEEALAYFSRAEDLYREESTAQPLAWEPRWGQPESLYFYGMTLERLKRPMEAVEFYRKALILLPNHDPARDRLAEILKGDGASHD